MGGKWGHTPLSCEYLYVPNPPGGEALCENAGVDPNARAETIDVAGFLRLAEAASAAKG